MLVFHDANFDARTTGTGRVDDATRSRAAALRYRAADAGICFLEEIVDVMAGSRTVLQVDLKLSRPITEFRARQLQSALLPLGDRVIVGSQAHWNLRALQDVPVAFDPTLQWCFSAAAPGLPRTLGVHGLWDDSPMAANARFEPEEYLEHRIRDLRGLLPNAVEWMVDIGTVLKIAELGVPLGERLRRNGCALAAWTLHAEDEGLAGTLKRLFKTGVETVITDAPGVAAKAAAALLL
jgi:glycerophosphoryl diester phosphodiesterase